MQLFAIAPLFALAKYLALFHSKTGDQEMFYEPNVSIIVKLNRFGLCTRKPEKQMRRGRKRGENRERRLRKRKEGEGERERERGGGGGGGRGRER